MSKMELHDDELDLVNGGDITYTWNGTSGTIGINGYNPFILVNKEAFVKYLNKVHGTMKDSEILTYLLEQGIAKKP